MNRLNAKRIGVLAASLLFGLAVAGPVTFSSIPIINSAGQPVVQIVVGSSAQPSDGVVAANIAATIGSMAFTSTPVTATVSGTSALKCVPASQSTCSISNQQVWLGESGTAAPSGTFGFTALIGSVLNRAVALGVPQFTKGLQTFASSYGYLRTASTQYTTTNSPQDSPYSPSSSVPTSTSASASSNGGGLAFTSFSTGSSDNILEVTSTQFPTLMNGAGTNGESEYLWLTGFPVYDQQTSPSVQSYAVINAGGAYEALFNTPIHEPYYSTSVTNGGAGTNSINNAAFTMLGQQWTIVGVTAPAAVGAASSTVATNGGGINIASSLVPMSTVYVGKNLTSGPFTVQVADLGSATSAGVSPAAINVYYKGVLTNNTSIFPPNTVKFNVSAGQSLYVKVNQTFAGLYAYQKYAKIQMYSNVVPLTNGGVFNNTIGAPLYNPGWSVDLLWTNKSGTGTHDTDLAGIIVYNTTPIAALLPTQSFTFIQAPKAFKVTLVGDTLGNNFDALAIQSQTASNINYANTPTNKNNGLGNINNVTEPGQELMVQSQIPGAFSVGGTSTSSLTYLLTPYTLTEVANAITANAPAGGKGAPVNVVIEFPSGYPTSNFISTTNPLLITVSGFATNAASSASSTTLTFNAGNSLGVAAINALQATTGNFYNITQVKVSRALPGMNVIVGTTANSVTNDFNDATGAGISQSGNTMATLSMGTTPQLIYSQTNGQVFSRATSGATVQYNQQNGQTTTPFTITTASPVIFSATNPLFNMWTFAANEINVPSNTVSTDSFSFNIVNSTAGVTASPMFQINYSTTSTHNNVTYTPYTGGGVNAQTGFRSERGSKVASIGSTAITLDMAKTIDTLQFVVGPYNTTPKSTQSKVGPFQVGSNLASAGFPNVTIAAVNASCTFSSSSCTISGLSGLNATPSVTQATTPVTLNTATTPIAVLDSNANSASTLIVVGSKFVNTVAAQIFTASPTLDQNFNTASVVDQAFGSNRILVAGWYANQTVQAGNQFIAALLSGSS